METVLSWQNHWGFREKVFYHFQLFTLFYEKNQEQLINCNSTDSDNISRGLHENSGGATRGSESPCCDAKKIQKKMATKDGHFDFMFLSEVYRSD